MNQSKKDHLKDEAMVCYKRTYHPDGEQGELAYDEALLVSKGIEAMAVQCFHLIDAVSDRDWDIIVTALERLLAMPYASGFPIYPDAEVEELLEELVERKPS